MVRILKLVDELLIKFFTKLSHTIQRHTQRTNFFLAKCSLQGLAAALFVGIANHWFPLLEFESDLPFTLVSGLASAWLLRWLCLCDLADEAARLHGKALLSLIQTYDFLLRLAFLAMSLEENLFILPVAINLPRGIALFKVVYSETPLFITLFLYFLIVKPLPPSEAKVEEKGVGRANAFAHS